MKRVPNLPSVWSIFEGGEEKLLVWTTSDILEIVIEGETSSGNKETLRFKFDKCCIYVKRISTGMTPMDGDRIDLRGAVPGEILEADSSYLADALKEEPLGDRRHFVFWDNHEGFTHHILAISVEALISGKKFVDLSK